MSKLQEEYNNKVPKTFNDAKYNGCVDVLQERIGKVRNVLKESESLKEKISNSNINLLINEDIRQRYILQVFIL